MSELILESAMSLADKIRRRELTALEVVDAHIARMHAVNPRLNAVVEMREARAREEARAADRVLDDRGPGAVGPLHGVPCTIKESFELESCYARASGFATRGTTCSATTA